jgi:hypothetical protein
MKRAQKQAPLEVREPIGKLVAENKGRRFLLD